MISAQLDSAVSERLKQYLRDLLRLRQDRRYRMGLLQGAISFGVITQREWERYVWQVNAGRKAPKG